LSSNRQKLENQSGLTIANEMRNNSNKMGRWGLQATLAGAKDILIGFDSSFKTETSFHSSPFLQICYPKIWKHTTLCCLWQVP